MKQRLIASLLAALLSLAAAAQTDRPANAAKVKPADERRVMAVLKRNPIVTAAVRQAQRFGGTDRCDYEVLRASAAPAMSAEVRDFEAEITCLKDEASGIVRVQGRIPGSAAGFEEVQVSISFAG